MCDYFLSGLDIEYRDSISLAYEEVCESSLYNASSSFIEEISPNIRYNIFEYSGFLLDYSHQIFGNELKLYSGMSRNGDKLRTVHTIGNKNIIMLDRLAKLIRSYCEKCEGIEKEVALCVFNRMMLDWASEKGKDILGLSSNKYDIDKCIRQSIENNIIDLSDMYSITIFILCLYSIKALESFLQLPMYNQYKAIITRMSQINESLNQEMFERKLLAGSKKSINKYTIDQVDLMNGIEFEILIAKIFQSMGYTVTMTKTTNDQGIDIIAEMKTLNGVTKIGIQTKSYSTMVGNKAVQEVLAGIMYYKLDRGLVVTRSGFTKSAIKLAESGNVVLWDRFILSDKLSNLN